MTSVAAGSLLSLGFGYSGTQNNGNLLSQTIATPGFSATQNYGYDGANRLTSASEGSTWGQTYVYDNVGNRAVLSSSNIIFSDATPQTGSTSSVPYTAANQWTLAGYDSAGNMTAGNTQSARLETMAYDAEERMTQWADTNPSVSVTFTYDGDGRRVTKTWNGVTTVYVYDPLGNLAAEYGGSAAPVGGTLYLTQDQLGSTRLVSNYNAATGQPQAVGCHDYLPFGEEIPWGRAGVPCYSQTADTAIKFTGQERDSETGLDNFIARYYSGGQGRFTSPDEPLIDQFPPDPQSWILYGYVRNNPLGSVDLSGRDCIYTSNYNSSQSISVSDEQGGCSESGGTYVPGSVDISSVNVDTNSGILNYAYTPYDPNSNYTFSNLELPDPGLQALQQGTQLAGTLVDPLLEATLTFAMGPGIDMLAAVAPEVTIGPTVAIGKMWDLKQPVPGENQLDLPNQGTPKANWKQNAGKLRRAMEERRPIRDRSAEPFVKGKPANITGFTAAERYLLKSSGWTYRSGYWYPPGW